MRKAFGLTFIKQCFLVLGCLYGAQFFTGLFSAIDCGPPPVAVGPMGGVASSDVDSTDVTASKQYDACMVKVRSAPRRSRATSRSCRCPLCAVEHSVLPVHSAHHWLSGVRWYARS